MKDAINNIFDKVKSKRKVDMKVVRAVIDELDDARAEIEPKGQMSDLLHRIRREMREGIMWVGDQNSLAMATILIGVSLNDMMEAILGEDDSMTEEDVAAVYPAMLEAWFISISDQLGVELEE